jgi:hypothetical protein
MCRKLTSAIKISKFKLTRFTSQIKQKEYNLHNEKNQDK